MVQRQRAETGDSVSEAPVKDRLLDINRPARRVAVEKTGDDASSQDTGAMFEDGLAQMQPVQEGADKHGFWYELLSELMYLEATSAYWALQAANPADLDYQKLQRSLQSSQICSAGETASNEQLTCLQCFRKYSVQGTVQVEPCECGCQYFSVGPHH